MNLPGDFYPTYWQKAPYFQAGAVALDHLTPSPETLWDWARDSDCARLIQPDQNFNVTLNPDTRPDDCHTLLVGQIEQHSDAWDRWSRSLDAIGRWSFSDLMISHATQGASVGAHRDQYDVFLIQLAGQRRWDVGQISDLDLPEIDRGGSKLLDGFVSHAQYIANPGDLLYVPPGCGHLGVALDDQCMTLSVGFRQPTLGEVTEHLLEALSQTRSQDYRDQPPGLTVGNIATLREQLIKAINAISDQTLAKAWALACTQTAEADSDAATGQVRFASGVRAAQLTDTEAVVMGEVFPVAPALVHALVSEQGVKLDDLTPEQSHWIEEFRDAGWLEDR